MIDRARVPVRRGRPGYDQETVLRRAVALFNERGYDGTSIGDIARDLGVTKSAIYHHVPSKETLLAAALDEALVGLAHAIDVAVSDPHASPYERLTRAVRSSVVVLVEHQPAVTLLLRVRGNSVVEQDALARRRALDERLATLVAEAAANGSVRDDLPPALASRLVFGLVNSLVEWYRPDGAVDADALADAVVEVALDGLRPRPLGS